MVRIAVIGLRGVPDVMGGIETHCTELLPRMLSEVSPSQLEITVLARRGYVSDCGIHGGVRQIPLWSPRQESLETIIHTFIALLYARIVLHADIVHLHAIGPGLLAPFARLLGFRLLFTHHGEDYQRQKWGGFAKAALRLGESFAVRFANRIVTVSRSTHRRLCSAYPAKADLITHISNGFTQDSGVPTPDALLDELGLTRGRYIVAVGRLVPEKAHDLLIEAFRRSRLSRETPAWKLVIVGDADHESAYANGIRAQVAGDDRIVLAGRRPRSSVLALNGAAGLFVLPSYHEGLSIAALEAIHVGAPILLSDIEANLNIDLPDNHYFRTGSAESLAERLDGNLSAHSVGDDFDPMTYDWTQIARKTLDQIDALTAPVLLQRQTVNGTDHDEGL